MVWCQVTTDNKNTHKLHTLLVFQVKK